MFNQINDDLKTAMKNGDKFRLSVLRMLKSALQLEQINALHALEDKEVIAVLKKQVKMRKDSILEFEKFNKLDEVQKLQDEINIINEYLPTEMSEDEIRKVINTVFEELKPTSLKDMGGIMKALNDRITNADMSLVSKIVKEKLS